MLEKCTYVIIIECLIGSAFDYVVMHSISFYQLRDTQWKITERNNMFFPAMCSPQLYLDTTSFCNTALLYHQHV